MIKSFQINTLLRLSFIFLLLCTFTYLLFNTSQYILLFFLTILIGFCFYNLTQYVNQSNYQLSQFLDSIRYNDFSVSYADQKKGDSFSELSDTYNLLIEKYKSIKAEKEINYQYLNTIVEQVNVGIICISDVGEIKLYNHHAKQLLHKPYLHNSESLEKISPLLYQTIQQLQSGKQQLLSIPIKHQVLKLSVRCAAFKLGKQNLRLFTLQNIQRELEEQEIKSYKKLIRILTHEIMNSVTPIISLSSSMHDFFKDENRQMSEQDWQQMQQAFGAIERRSQGLLNFTETYRNLTRIPEPDLQTVNLNQLIERITTLLEPELNNQDIKLVTKLSEPTIELEADAVQLEQVFINLIKNAIEALHDQKDGIISIDTYQTEKNNCIIQITDNGPGIEPALIDQLFIPFFTTKKEGSGIGLNLSREMIIKHGGRLTVQSIPNQATTLTVII